MQKEQLNKVLKKYRQQAGYTQEKLAPMLGISRAILAHIEMGIRKPKEHELKKYSEIFDIDINSIKQNIDNPNETYNFNKEKFIELLMYIIEKCGAKHNMGKTVLYKLLYFSEFDYYELYNQHISGIKFVRLPNGPAPFGFDFLIKDLEEKKEIVRFLAPYGTYIQERLVPNREVDYSKFSNEEKNIIDEVVNKYSDLSAREISKISHQDIPWKLAEDGEIIEYDFVKKREYPFSRIAKEKRKKQEQKFAKKTGFFDDLENEPDLYEEYRNV